jgi:UDP-N-acetylmuramoylalanine--D-glutamate ligase
MGLSLYEICEDRLREVLSNFELPAHRARLVLRAGGLEFYDSSIDSTPGRTATTLAHFPNETVLILGGRGKKLSYEPLRDAVAKLRRIIIYGEERHAIRAALEGATSDEPIITEGLYDAVREAIRAARAGDRILLSPAATSLDSFKDYAERGEFFLFAARDITDKSFK